MKKKLFATIISLAMLTSISINSFAANDTTDILMTEQEYQLMLQEDEIEPLIESCCGKRPAFNYRHKYRAHIYDEPRGWCKAVVNVGEKYCIYCGAIWDYDYIYETLPACGAYHG